MTYASPTPADLETYLGVTDLNLTRAQMLLTQSENLARAEVDPLPDGAEAVVLASTSRAFINPTQSTSQTAGPFNVGSPNYIYLTRAERRVLRRLAGIGGGAFTIDPTPVDAMSDFRDPLESPTLGESEELMRDWWPF